MSIPESQAEAAAFLTGLAGAAPVETHISAVFLGADTAWKLKKAVRLSFLDFSTIAARRHFLRREVELNAPAAPGLYRDVVPLRRGADGALCLGEADAPPEAALEWVLRMARVPDGDFLDVLAARGGLSPGLLTALADAVTAYHARLPALVRDWPAALRQVLGGVAASALEAGLDRARVAAWEAAVGGLLAQRAERLAARQAGGCVRRGHGDLHLGNLCLWQGRPVPFDALEFDEALAEIDIGYDTAFLLMDLDVRVGRPAANAVLNRGVARSGDAGLVGVLAPYLALRAMVRAQVECRRGRDWQPYLAAAEAYARPGPGRVVAIGGLQGSGKSTLARALAPGLGPAPGALVLRSDEIRKRLHGVAPEARLGPHAYTDSANARCNAALLEALRQAACGGHAVIVDATFLDPAQAAAVQLAAGAAGLAFTGYWLDAPLAVLEQRVAARRGDASDAGIAVLRAAAARHPGAPPGWRVLDATPGLPAVESLLQ